MFRFMQNGITHAKMHKFFVDFKKIVSLCMIPLHFKYWHENCL